MTFSRLHSFGGAAERSSLATMKFKKASCYNHCSALKATLVHQGDFVIGQVRCHGLLDYPGCLLTGLSPQAPLRLCATPRTHLLGIGVEQKISGRPTSGTVWGTCHGQTSSFRECLIPGHIRNQDTPHPLRPVRCLGQPGGRPQGFQQGQHGVDMRRRVAQPGSQGRHLVPGKAKRKDAKQLVYHWSTRMRFWPSFTRLVATPMVRPMCDHPLTSRRSL